MKALLGAYPCDRAALFWSRHRVKVEFYKFANVADAAERDLLCGVASEVAQFVHEHMRVSAERIQRHNDTMLKLPVDEAKRFRKEYLEKEAEHESWCKQKIKAILQRRPPPPFPYC